MVNRAERLTDTRRLQLGRMAVCCVALGLLPACAYLRGNGTGESATSGSAYMPVTFDGVPNSLEDGARDAVSIRAGAPTSLLDVRRRANQAADTLQEYLASEGYFAAVVTPDLVEDMDMTPRLDVDPGERFTIASVTLAGTGDLPEEVLTRLELVSDELGIGTWAVTEDIESLDKRLVTTLRKAGYAFAESEGIDALASRADSTLELTYSLSPGPRVRLGDLIVPVDLKTRPGAIRTLRNWQPGDFYKPDTMETLRTRLRSTDLFDGIGVKIAENPGTDGYHSVELQLSEGKRRSISAGLSVSTSEGAGATASWERRNLTGVGDTLGVDAQIATLTSELTLSYERPNIGRYGRDFSAETGIRAEETDAYDLQGVSATASLSQPFNDHFTLSAGATIDATRSTDYELRSAGQDEYVEQVTFSFPLGATYDTVKQPLDPQAGNRIALGVEPGVSVGDSEAPFTRITTSASTYRKITDRLVAAVRAEAGTFLGDDDVPVDRKFYAGGGGSVRGFEYQSLSPTDTDGNIIGGDAMFAASAELRFRHSDRWGYVAFVDSGYAAGSIDEAISEMRMSAGFGIRFYPGFGPIRFDIATPLDRQEGEDPVQIYVSIGQAF
ncbi:autotransporter assembly complex family protein [Hyphomonas sp.]|uniref:autotransporter assembly complex protein TamA n=1 Tax=Hyphomonas sp. TaxID=87 RepID=UPI0025BBB05B|nr:autotransporter assembly complex family protein [Hyphomonas sp.]